MGGLYGRPFFVATPPPPPPRAIVYIDGFNFYYGELKNTPHKWLDIQAMAERLRNAEDVVLVRYFTSFVMGPSAALQSVYVQALSSLPKVRVQLGRFKNKTITCMNEACTFTGNRRFTGVEEKRTDVAIGVDMVDDAYQDRCDRLILISGDSDLVPAVRLVRRQFPQRQVIVYVPGQRGTAQDGERRADELRQVASDVRPFPAALLRHCQLAEEVTLPSGHVVRRPAKWG